MSASKVKDAILQNTIDRVHPKRNRTCWGDSPNRRFFCSCITPQETDSTESKGSSFIGITFDPLEHETYRFSISFSIFHPDDPSYQEYVDFSKDISMEDEHPMQNGFYRRVDFEEEIESTIENLEQKLETATDSLNSRITQYLENNKPFADLARSDWDNSGSMSGDQFQNLDFKLIDESDLNSLLDDEWINLTCTSRDEKVQVKLWNNLETAPKLGLEYIFAPKIQIKGKFNQIEFPHTNPENYQYDESIWCTTQNISSDSQKRKDDRIIETKAIPRTEVYEDDFSDSYEHDFEKLSNGNIDSLKATLSGMKSYADDWESGDKKPPGLSEDEEKEFMQSLEEFRDEIKRFEKGIELLESNDELKTAFELMNQTNYKMHWENPDEGFRQWRLFQVVFIVSNLHRICYRETDLDGFLSEDIGETQVLWFPTGGGKTEAYVGLILTSIFYDRLRGKQKGVSSWIRFPLRLLSRQQSGRFLKALMFANEVKPTGFEGENFTLGVFVGSHDTLNSLKPTHKERLNQNEFSDINEKEYPQLSKCYLLDNCPKCETSLRYDYDFQREETLHICDNCGELPLRIIDEELYRRPPTVLLGSLDSIARMGLNPRFSNLIGNVSKKCPDHGYGSYKGCIVCDRDWDELKDVDPKNEFYDPIPSLHLVDEVHLLSEELGTFSAHYETAFRTLCEKVGNTTPQVIASTATIAKYEEQMRSLFDQRANVFPTKGPNKDENFYVRKDKSSVKREYLGIKPMACPQLLASLRLVKKIHQSIISIRKRGVEWFNSEYNLALDEEEFRRLLRYYELSIVYFNSKRQKDIFRNSIRNQINDELLYEGYDYNLNTAQLTADIEELSIEKYESLIQNPEKEFEDRTDVISATSFIGHGIDVDAFNIMVFHSTPNKIFQYIQSSSRVGRKKGVPGIVIDMFNPFFEISSHRYKYFDVIHRNLETGIEPVPVDRWAANGIERTFSGILTSMIYQHLGIEAYRQNDIQEFPTTQKGLKQFVDSEYVSRETLLELMKECYFPSDGVSSELSHNGQYPRKIQDKVDEFWEKIQENKGDKPLHQIVNSQMISLRDIGESVVIESNMNHAGLEAIISKNGEKT